MKHAALFLSLLSMAPALAQPAVDSRGGTLFDTIAAQDKKLFDAYNSCDVKTQGDIVSDDLEFYHDQTGLAVGREPFLKSTRENICGKVHRELVPGSLEVYPLKTYGAVEIGEHVFCPAAHPEQCDPKTSGIAKFTMLWKQTDAGWKLTRVISYAHVSDTARK
ncbi:MAG TPA: nuclear transport factor 2 family protein [Rhizomicrobium sp.]|jgi:hypothetical protein|nr:nuclear transport factor 2 family protein [Rhizomicrobium sp.]